MTNIDTQETIDFKNQNSFIADLIKKKIQLIVYLINGVKLDGTIISSDDYCLFLARDTAVQLVYKHAVATIMPRNQNGSNRIPDYRNR
jgi:host factor-I protein